MFAPAGDLASPSQRFIAGLLDILLLGLIGYALAELLSADSSLGLNLILYLTLLFGYFVPLEGGAKGSSLGKRLMAIRFVDASSGGPIGYRRAAGRRAGYLIGYPSFGLSWLRLTWDEQHRALHDEQAGTVVVRARSQSS